MKNKGGNWLFAVALSLPMIIFFAAYLFHHDASLTPTGFIQYDNVSYVAYARQYLDTPAISLFYNNPFNESGNYTPIYFQFQTAFFALLLASGMAPGLILIPFTILCTIVCFRIIIAIYDNLVPSGRYRVAGITLFAWGGGLLTIAGSILKLVNSSVDNIFFIDPAAGWWGLNLGRSLFFSCEAFYHLLFLGTILYVLKKNWLGAFVLVLIASISHPFTGIEILSIITAWILIERFLIQNREIPAWFIISILVLLSLHLFYYLYYLPTFPDHRSVSEQYALNWRLRFFNMIPAYGPVALIALIGIWKIGRTRFLSMPQHRLFLTWFIVAFLLANHEIFMTARQPIHFTRGYIWTSLFLLAIPGIHFILDRLRKYRYGLVATVIFFLLLFSDNFSWIYANAASKVTTTSTAYISKEQQDILNALNKHADAHSLLISRDDVISYMATVYTSTYSWYSHPYTTPSAKRKKAALDLFFEKGNIDSSWNGKRLFCLIDKQSNATSGLPGSALLLETANYKLVELKIP